jgi:acetyltransferase-like isoleucine patch superfamily enzyme
VAFQSKDIEFRTIAAGNPTKVIRRIDGPGKKKS